MTDRTEAQGLRAALAELTEEAKRANRLMLKECGIGVLDLNAIARAEAALSATPQASEPAPSADTRYFTAVYRDVKPGEEARAICEHPKWVGGSWSHVMDERDAARAQLAAPSAPEQPSAAVEEAKPVAWMVTGGRAFVDRAFMTEARARNSVEDRKDGARVAPLYTAPPEPLRVGALSDAAEAYLEAQGALDNRELNGINAESHGVLQRRVHAARDHLETVLATSAAEVPAEWSKAVQEAYGWLWHVNNEPMAPIQMWSPESAAHEARKCLRDLLTTEQRGEAINAVQGLLANKAATTPGGKKP
jgi:hypothetical protein